ncbi:MAG: DUF4935 domain-containing protein [Rhodospirillaceae bacterium]|nr:DUF4935 domain-containing protein [Rhodospirillaceae bacterium]
MPDNPIQVFFDANVLISTGKPPGGPIFRRIADLVKGGFISVLTTDVTVQEVARKHVENDYEVIKELSRSHFRKITAETLNIPIREVTKEEIRTSLFRKYGAETDRMFKTLQAKVILIDSVQPSKIFFCLQQKEGFFSGEGKQHQFSDAFIFESLRQTATDELPIIIITNDDDFLAPTKGEKNLSVLRSVPDLFKHLDLEIKAPEVEAFLEEHNQDLVGLFDSELKNWSLFAADVEDAEIEVDSVSKVTLSEIATFDNAEKDGSHLVVGTALVTASVSYTHPDWETAIYDSEDKVLIPLGDSSGETEIELEVDFSLSILLKQESNEPEEIDGFEFRNDDFTWVTLHSDVNEY